MSTLYSFKDYDKYFSLKVSFGLWLVILFLLRPYILIASSFRMGRGGSGVSGAGGLKDLVYPDHLSIFLAILVTIPVLIFVYAWTRRKPGATEFVRNIWRNGMFILIATAVLNIVIVLVPLLIGEIRKIPMVGWTQAGLSVVVIMYLLTSQRDKDAFADFPEEEIPGKK